MQHQVKRAIIPAAGLGSRLRPITDTTPKSLVKVRGTPMIESVLRALVANGIHEIYVVVGYLKEQFRYLPQKYPGLTLIENPYYETCNNISSLYMAREHLEDAMILDADQLISNPAVLAPQFERSGYNCVWTASPTDEWLLAVENGVVTGCSRTGGTNGWQLFSVSRWSREDGRKLKRHLETEFDQHLNRNIFWDDLALFTFAAEYELGIHPMQYGDVVEIDSLDDLISHDPSYAKLLGGG